MATSCLVVGEMRNTPHDETAPVVGDFNGPGWTLGLGSVPPGPAGATGRLSGVACATATSCFGVGAYSAPPAGTHIEHWNGNAWSRVASPNPNGRTSSVLNAITCPTSALCLAVGTYADGPKHKTLVERWTGKNWTVVASPDPPGSSTRSALSTIACTSANACFAAGSSIAGHVYSTLVLRWNGTKWVTVPSPNPAGATSLDLAGLSCTTPSSCFAVGRYTKGSRTAPLIERWNGSAWALVASPLPSGKTAELNAVACPTAAGCFAVGSFVAKHGLQTLIERWNGSTWAIVPKPIFGAFNAISCRSMTACVAVGVSGGALLDVWNGSSWSVSHSGSSYGSLFDVSCTSPTFCLAVGGTYTAPGRRMFVERWDGHAWSMIPSLQPPTGQEYVPEGITCATSTLCFVVGNRQGDGGVKPLIQEWNGTSWVSLDGKIAGLNGDLGGVSCASTTNCFAAGYAYHGGDNATTVIVQWNGTSWSVVPSPSPSILSYLFNVTCSSASNCFALGDQTSSIQNGYTSLILRWNGTEWAVVESPAIAGVSFALGAVACVSDTSCMGVGRTLDSTTGTYGLLAERWDGASWSIVSMPSPAAPGAAADVQDIACATAASCLTVGSYRVGETSRSLVEEWNGSSWSATPLATVGDGSGLSAMSCPSVTICFAVGFSNDRIGAFPLIERYS